MELWTVEINDFSMSHLEECPIWGTYDVGSGFTEHEVNLAIENEESLEVADGPFSIIADFQLAGGLHREGGLIVSFIGTESLCDPYAISIWTGKRLCIFNKNLDRMSKIPIELKMLNDDMGTLLTMAEIFPIKYKIRLPEDSIEMTLSGTFSLPE